MAVVDVALAPEWYHSAIRERGDLDPARCAVDPDAIRARGRRRTW